MTILFRDLMTFEGQVISKGFFGIFNFFQKTNKNTSHSSKNELNCSFFWKNSGYHNLLSRLSDLYFVTTNY